jgi:hypothetical protein
MVTFFDCTYAALPAVILWPVEVRTSNLRHNWFGLEQGLQSFANTIVLLPPITVVLEELILTRLFSNARRRPAEPLGSPCLQVFAICSNRDCACADLALHNK